MNRFEQAMRRVAPDLTVDDVDIDALVLDGAPMGPCIDRLVVGELDPTGRMALSRHGILGVRLKVRDLAEVLGTRLQSAPEASRADAEDAIYGAVAWGYILFGATIDTEILRDRTAEWVWHVWASHFREDPDKHGLLPAKEVAALHRIAGKSLHEDLVAAGLARKRIKLHERVLGRLYGNAGWYLRLCQSSNFPASTWDDVVQPPGTEHLGFSDFDLSSTGGPDGQAH